MTTTLTCGACHEKNTWMNDSYKQGLIFQCCSCSTRLQQVFCPHCSSSIMWTNPTVSAQGSKITCGSCSKLFQFLCCPHCRQINVWKDANCVQAHAYTCRSCTEAFQQICCAHCNKTNIYSKRSSIQGDHLACYSCSKNFQYIRCPHCHRGQFWKNCDYSPGAVVSCYSCKQHFAHMRCPHCFVPNFWKNPVNTTITFICYKCHKDMRVVTARSQPSSGDKAGLRHTSKPPSAFSQPIRKSRSSLDISQSKQRSPSVDNDRKPLLKLQKTPSLTKSTESCNYFMDCQQFVKSLSWPRRYFDTTHDNCYCQNCYPDHLSNTLRVANSDYVVPRGYAGFGLGVDPFRADNIWKTWIVVYHGTSAIAAQSIIDHRQFLLPGDHLIDGTQLAIRPGHIPGKVHVYTSPSIRYSSLEVYSTKYSFTSPQTGKHYHAQIVLQCKQKPGTFQTQGETIGWGQRRICQFIPNDRIEYFSERRSTIIPYRLLIRLEDA